MLFRSVAKVRPGRVDRRLISNLPLDYKCYCLLQLGFTKAYALVWPSSSLDSSPLSSLHVVSPLASDSNEFQQKFGSNSTCTKLRLHVHAGSGWTRDHRGTQRLHGTRARNGLGGHRSPWLAFKAGPHMRQAQDCP